MSTITNMNIAFDIFSAYYVFMGYRPLQTPLASDQSNPPLVEAEGYCSLRKLWIHQD